ncbi:hypothetical protein [Pseudonocardia endophytica]|uniref:4-amino-4-deoxy-L-arabinose transferase-like glycosyltransferase n=1 Tax=Pseudonocardia endophytica TaxID=401976 RepID=A0A4R1HXQ5_PSEEN|nr:hypothetical protein [Pseudonocardia endophytica]TCK27557.1 hypothetical protein EV378_3429 [Pseudonocardia endophytica]
MVQSQLRSRALPAVAWAGPGLLVGAGLLLFGPAGLDDSYITFGVVDRLLATGAIENYNGDPVEQSSSLLHVLVLAVVTLATSLPVPIVGLLVGVLFGAATTVLAAVLAERLQRGAAAPAALIVGTGAYLVHWSFGGLETSLAAFVLLLAAAVTVRVLERGTGSGVLVAFTAVALAQTLVRPEAGFVLIAGLVGAGVLLRRYPDAVRRLAVLVAVAAAVGIAVALVRWGYTGHPVPQPVVAKTGAPVADTVLRGLTYFDRWLLRPVTVVVIVVALAGAFLHRGRRPAVETVLWAFAAAGVAAAVFSGGDLMMAGRFFVPSVAVIGLLAGVGFVRAAERYGRRVAVGLAAVLVGAQVIGLGQTMLQDSAGQPAWAPDLVVPGTPAGFSPPWVERRNRVHLRDAAFLPAVSAEIDRLRAKLGRPVLVGGGQAGMVMRYLELDDPDRQRYIDTNRLADDTLAPCDALTAHSPIGAHLSYRDWMASPTRCGAPEPDLIFDLRPVRDQLLSTGRYVLVHEQADPTLPPGAAVVPGTERVTGQFVAVRADLFDGEQTG